jgi:hypothetical protein
LILGPGFKIGPGLHLDILSFKYFLAEKDYMVGSESSRPAAKYKAAKALFQLLLSAPYQSIWMSRADDVRQDRRDAGAEP